MTKTVEPRFSLLILVALLLSSFAFLAQEAMAAVQRFKFTSGDRYLIVELLDDDLVHFELSAVGSGPDPTDPIFTTPQVSKTDYAGPTTFSRSGNTFETSAIRVEVDPDRLCVTTTDKTRSPPLRLNQICPLRLTEAWKGLTISVEAMQDVYGLGEQFFQNAHADGDWLDHRVRYPMAGANCGDFGNAAAWDDQNGMVGNVQIPVMYAVGPDNTNYGLFLDQIYKQVWIFKNDPWQVETWGDQIRWYLMTGPDLPDVRKDYMELTGRPPAPPKKMLGLWVSQYPYRNWQEIDNRLSTLRNNKFPVDGFMLDLNWFGGVKGGSDDSPMGGLTWDLQNFPNPAATIANYKNNQGIGLMTIEESYIANNRDEHNRMQSRCYLVRRNADDCTAIPIEKNNWWGRGGMIDWTQDAAGAYWHDQKRQPLIKDGVIGHWLDLGEPEICNPDDWVAGVLPGKHFHSDYHNIYNLKWAESVARGYARNGEQQRPFVLTRSGAAGIQRFGAAMWSADITAKLIALTHHHNAQMHMSMAGVDYFGADIGGFRREKLDADINELYTQWFANGAWFDTPLRPHVDTSQGCSAGCQTNTCSEVVSCGNAPQMYCNCRYGTCAADQTVSCETAPDRVGDAASNQANLRQRYELVPYLYSLAHRAYRYGEAVMPPLVYYYQTDNNVRDMGNEKLVGRDLLVAVVATAGERQRGVYLPAGDWINYHTQEWFHSQGQWYNNQPAYINGLFRLPAYARAGAIIPKMYVDDATMNVLGKRSDGSTRNELIARVYASPEPSSFTLYEDDGETIAYQRGEVRTTGISQQKAGTTATVTISASSGGYTNAPASRVNVVELVAENTQATTVSLNGESLTQHANKAAFDKASEGWYNAGGNLIVAKSSSVSVNSSQTFVFTLGQAPTAAKFVCQNGTTIWGQSVYVVGNAPQLGNWAPGSAVKLAPKNYPTWEGTISNLPPNTALQWKCIKRQEINYPPTADQWQPDPNNSFTTAGSGDNGTTSGAF